jgi:gamma-glutamyl-gamma-aminobutyrate hydrolase PuuD
MMMTKRVYVENNDNLIAKMFLEEGFTLTDKLFEADLLCLEGGADVTPALYYEENVSSHCDEKTDVHSFGLMKIARMLDIPVVGICRGGQVINVYNGGKMRQHINGHGIHGTHNLTYEGQNYQVSSVHHQECIPPTYLDDLYITRADDGTVEVVEFGGMLSFQPHPEYHQKGHSCRVLFFKLLKTIMG